MKKKRIHVKALAAAAAVAGGMALLGGTAVAQVSGVCSDCHTMHNSQDGGSVVATGPESALTKGDCVGCHTTSSTTGNGGTSNIPYVYHSGGVTYNDPVTAGDNLAGGDFYWVASVGDPKGHNVAGIAAADATLGNTPPGNGGTALAAQLSCAGTNGCHGDKAQADDFAAISGAHHADDATIDGASVGTSYRFLKGVLGLEDSDWEYQPTATAHNQYKGVDRTAETENDATTISSLCAQCHGDFHNGTGNIASSGFASPWVRHPTDFDMNNVKGDATNGYTEYAYYNGGDPVNGNTYSVEAPVASADVSAVKSTVLAAADDAIVTCVSCHRAHGSPYDDLLRWDYSTMDAHAGASNRGCFVCHTTKDA